MPVEEKVRVALPVLFPKQQSVVDFVLACLRNKKAGRAVERAGRRFGKTVGAADVAVEALMEEYRVLYATPTGEQLGKFWFEVNLALEEGIRIGALKRNETEHFIERPGTEQRIKGKTAWNADTMRGDYADLLILDEWQLMDEDAWEVIGAPMLLDHNGTALFIYTPPSLRSAGVSKARDPRHAAKMFKMALADTTGRWRAFHFTSHDNPHISKVALSELIQDMSKQSYRQEILAEDDEIQLTWLVWKAFNEETRKIARFEIPKEWPRYSGHDFGEANPAALFFAQVKGSLPPGACTDIRYNDFIAYREYLPGKGSTLQHVDEFKRLTNGLVVERSTGGSHQEEGIRQGYGALGWSILEPMDNSVKVQLDRGIGMMESGKLWIFNDMYQFLEEIMNCLWEPDKDGKPTDNIKDKARYHLCDCFRYFASWFTPERTGTQGSKMWRYGRAM